MNRNRPAAHCGVCGHPKAEVIESKFLQWESPRSLERRYALPPTSVYRHAKAFNLYEKRQDNGVDQTLDVSKFAEELESRSQEELDFYLENNRWPQDTDERQH